jgi:Phage tail sheath protein subtilisin-like domain/Phage tail sheath C-terminal domain
MAELILPGVFIEVRPEALIVPGPVSVGNIGIVGTAANGEIGAVEVIGSYADAREKFGPYDAFNPDPAAHPLTLVRALEIAYEHGASTVLAVRVTGTETKAAGDNFIPAWDKNTKARKASHNVAGASGNVAVLKAKSHGSVGNKIKIKIVDDPAAATKAIVTLTSGAIEEQYNVASGNELVTQVTARSALVTGDGGSANKPAPVAETPFAGGTNGEEAGAADYKLGLDQLINEDAHLIVAAGLDDATIAANLKAHVEAASTDKIKRDRIAIVGSALGATSATHSSQSSDRLIFVTPGLKVTDSAKAETTPDDANVILPGAYSAAAIAGMLSARDPHISLTNKSLSVIGLEKKFTSAELEQLVKASVLALEVRRGHRVVKAITTDTGAFRQITTRRIVDFTKFGVRSAAEPYIGLLNNDRVRKALKGTINGFLATMVDDEMLVSYELDVTATRDEEIRGIAKVTMTVRPTFSIDFIKVVMFLG